MARTTGLEPTTSAVTKFQVDVKRQYSIGAAPQEKLCVVDGARAEQVG
jgi:hypothetical protein